METSLKVKIFDSINSKQKNGLPIASIFNRIQKKSNKKLLNNTINHLIETGYIFKKDDVLFTSKSFNLIPAKIKKRLDNFCFATALNSNVEYFIPSRFSKNSLFGDVVLIKNLSHNNSKYIKNKSKNYLNEGKVVYICKKNNITFTGTIIKLNNNFYVKPDEIFSNIFKIKNNFKEIKENIKIIAKINRQNFNILNPFCEIIKVFGDSSKAFNCAKACIINNEISLKFSKKVLKETAEIELKNEDKINNRIDLTKQPVFTIDSETAKDLDDAVSIQKTDFGYFLGIHIADVSNFIELKSEIDKEALKRGNSIYIADKVIPMISKKLSNGLCSLNPNEIKLTFSVLIDLDFNGKIIKFNIKKTKIKSQLKGIYEEINQIFNNNYKSKLIQNKLNKKYDKIKPYLNIMLELSNKLKNIRIKRGSLQLQSNECEIKLDKTNNPIEIKKKEQNIAENIIEEFMLLANECVAKFTKSNNIAIFYRIHDKPTVEKVENLKNIVNKLGLNASKIKPNMKAKILTELIKKYKNSDFNTILKSNILITMSKAKYDTNAKKHYGLALTNYTHFTSPIRRYCDLTVHRILTEFLYQDSSARKVNKKYKKLLNESVDLINKSENIATKLERICENYFKAEFMTHKIGQIFDAIITSCNNNGMFVQLENTIEGFVNINTLDGNYCFDGFFQLISKSKNNKFKIGQKIKVKCIYANVSTHTIDFKIVF